MIRANFNTYNSYTTDTLYQWDINQDLAITGLNLSVAPEIHFANANMERAIVRQSTLDSGVVTVRIPNSLLQEALTIKAYVGVYDRDTFNVIEIIEIPVIAKSRPADYQIQDSDEEIYSFKLLENEIANAKKKIADQCDDNLVAMKASIDETTKTLSAQIANIVAHNNDTESNSELIDMRVDQEGNTHASAGEAIRYQNDKISNDLLTLTSNVNVLNDTWSQGSINSNGENESFNKAARNDSFIKSYDSNARITLKNGYSAYLFQYNENKEFVKRSVILNNGDEYKTEIGFVRFVVFKSDFSEISIPNVFKTYISVKFVNPVINQINNEIDYLKFGDLPGKTVLNLGGFEQGGIDGNGNNESWNKSARTLNKIEVNHSKLFIIAKKYKCRLWFYDKNGNFMGSSKILSDGDEIISASGFVRVTVFSEDFTETMNPNTISENISIYRYIEGIRKNEESMYNLLNGIVSSTFKRGMLSGTTISDISHKVASPSDAKADKNGNVYVGCYVSDISAHEGSSPYAVLNKFNVLYPEKSKEIVAFKIGDKITGKGNLIDGSHNLAIAEIDDSKLRLMSVFKASGDNGWYLGSRDFNKDTNELTDITTCNFKLGDEITPLNTVNALAIAKSLGLSHMDAVDSEELYFPQIVKFENYFYTMGTFGSHSNIFLRSEDCITWEFISEPPVDNPCGEFAFKVWNGQIIAVNRSGGNYGEVYNLYVLKYNIANKTWSKLKVNKYMAGGAKPSLAIQNGYAYFLAWVDGSVTVNGVYLPRTYKTLYKAKLDSMELISKIGVSPDVPLCDTFLVEIGTAIYMLTSTDKRGFILSEASDGRSEISFSYFDTSLFDLIK